MASKTKINALKRVLDHPDKEEIFSRLILDQPPEDLHQWLSSKYDNVNEKKFILSSAALKTVKNEYLDVYSLIQDDIAKTKKAVKNDAIEELTLSLQSSSAYKNKMLEVASKEIDIREIIKGCINAIEMRMAQIFDSIQEDPRNINTRIDRVFIDYMELFGNIIEKYYKMTEAPAETLIQNNTINVQMVDQHILAFYDVIRDVLSQMDLESSMLFMELFNQRIGQLKLPAEKPPLSKTEVRLAEAQIINQQISQKLNEN